MNTKAEIDGGAKCLRAILFACLMAVCLSGCRERKQPDFYQLLVAKDYKAVKAAVNDGASVDTADGDGNTVLILGVGCGDIDICEFLIRKGANVNVQNKYGDTALIFAAYSGDTNLVSLLLNSGANKGLTNNSGQSAMDWAKRKKENAEVIALLSR